MKRLVVGNLKMNLLSPLEREKYFEFFDKESANKELDNIEIVLCPPFVYLEAFKNWAGKKLAVGAQNMFAEMKGSYTGEISPAMVKNAGCDYVILGHSERRRYFLEKNEEINLKVMAALKVGLKPIICVGESQTEKENQATLQVITDQVKECLFGVSRTKMEKIVIAYEPIWAVGTDEVPPANDIMEAKVLIRKILVGMFGRPSAEKVAILYGGSVNARTVEQVCVEPGMDGALVGRESLTPYEFLKIAEIINNY
ncbi:MAG: triose-phosphate isomerase [Candidatus Moranbacteria bacterium]|nr:triose-phosphate isomerase [Candidatus Moranbacteria bacterium]